MKVTQITSNSIQLTRLGLINCYLVREHAAAGEPDSFTLIDTTISGGEDDILAAAQAAGAPIRRILLTHAHVDHVGSVDGLMGKIFGCQLATSERSLPLLNKPVDKSLRPGEPPQEIKGGLPGIDATPNHVISPGELYGSLRAIATPGHIPGHLSFLDERDGTLFAGDALVSVGHLAVSGYAPWFFPLPNVATWSKPTAVASATHLLDFSIERYACGHGAIREGGLDALRTAITDATGS